MNLSLLRWFPEMGTLSPYGIAPSWPFACFGCGGVSRKTWRLGNKLNMIHLQPTGDGRVFAYRKRYGKHPQPLGPIDLEDLIRAGVTGANPVFNQDEGVNMSEADFHKVQLARSDRLRGPMERALPRKMEEFREMQEKDKWQDIILGDHKDQDEAAKVLDL